MFLQSSSPPTTQEIQILPSVSTRVPLKGVLAMGAWEHSDGHTVQGPMFSLSVWPPSDVGPKSPTRLRTIQTHEVPPTVSQEPLCSQISTASGDV